MKKNKFTPIESGFSPLLIIFIIIAIIGVIGYFAYKDYSARTQTPLQSASPEAAQTTNPSQGTSTGIYKNHYGEYQIKLPDKWEGDDCMGEDETDCAAIFPTSLKLEDFPDGVINMSVAIGEGNLGNPNLNIPALGKGLNATFTMSSDKEQITFVNRGVNYTFTADINDVTKANLTLDSVEPIIKEIAAGTTFLNEPTTCSDPALIPISGFPDNFALFNYHDSDQTDPMYNVWPITNVNLSGKDLQNLQDDAKNDSHRGFVALYVKDGQTFNADSSFASTVASIHPIPSQDYFNENGTGLVHYNCIDTEDDGPGFDQPYQLSEVDNDPFSLHAFGKAANSGQLWNVAKWNLKLLESTRNEIYIKRGNTWQAYKATGYFATFPSAYGGKPAIYLYPTETENVRVEIHPQGNLLKTDGLYNPADFGWNVTADSNGLINNSQKYLYYEALLPVPVPENGYVIPYSELFDFSKKYVLSLGLTDTEANEFINFWKVKLPVSPYYFVSNLDQQTIAQIYPLKITPKPDTLIRVEVYFKPIKDVIKVSLPAKPNYPTRNGFTAVEWGGILDQR